MKRHTARECTVEEFDDWCAATDRHEAVAQAADEEGGPSLSLVPQTERGEVWPTDLLPPAAPDGETTEEAACSGEPPTPIPATPFDGIPLEDSRKRLAGWSAERQRLFLCTSPRPARSISPPPPRACPRARPIGCAPARRPSPRPGTWRTSSPSAGSPPSPSIAP